jgi:hypothetical protein
MASSRSKAKRPAPDPTLLEEQARAALEREGAVKVSTLGPPAIRSQVVEQLVKQGFEASASWVRKPIEAQLSQVLADGAFLSLTAVGSHVVGASAAEAKRAGLALVASGKAQLVLRGAQEVIVPSSSPVLSREEARRFADVAKLVAKVAGSKKGVSLLRSDLSEALERAAPGLLGGLAGRSGRAQSVAASAQKQGDSAADLNRLLSVVDETRDSRTGLSFVPAIVAKLQAQLGFDVTKKTLLAAAMDGVLELRPEGGIHRLSAEELAVCPEGPQGTRLSWARRTETVAR